MSTIPGFKSGKVAVNGVRISFHIGGTGPDLILLHGFPQNHMCWAEIAPRLAGSFRCIVPDLRGYGDSSMPPDDTGHTAYSKRNMARDIVGLMDGLGIHKARIIGHDRGARVAYRMALDHPSRVERLAVVEVVPTAEFWRRWDAELALNGYHWTFLAQPHPLPEKLIAADPEFFVRQTLASWTRSGTLDRFSPAALKSYTAQMQEPDRVAAMCADYRAGATTDRRIDEHDIAIGNRIEAPVRFIWSELGFPAKTGNPLGIWRSWCRDLSGEPVTDCGHFMMEENPDGFLNAVTGFLEVDLPERT